MINKSNLFSRAWAIAKKAAYDTGEKASKFFSESLKMAWAELKKYAEKAKEAKEVAFRFSPDGHISTGSYFKLSGNTYQYKDIIKEIGFKWDAHDKTWFKPFKFTDKNGLLNSIKNLKNKFAEFGLNVTCKRSDFETFLFYYNVK